MKTVLNSDTVAVFKSMLKAFLDSDGIPMIRMGVSGWMFLLVPAYPGCPGPKAVKRLCVLKAFLFSQAFSSSSAH